MFAYCNSLTSLDLSSFSTSGILFFDNMFNGCNSLEILNFPNLDTSNYNNIGDMFLNCRSLQYINIRNYRGSGISEGNYRNIFIYANEYFVVCIQNNQNLINIIKNYKCHTVSCQNNWKEYKKKTIESTGSCTENCYLTSYKY